VSSVILNVLLVFVSLRTESVLLKGTKTMNLVLFNNNTRIAFAFEISLTFEFLLERIQIFRSFRSN
jgi:hypothetical protein